MSIIARHKNKYLKQLFHIENPADTGVQQVLSLRIGEKHIAFSITSKNAAELFQLAYCTAEEWNETELGELLLTYPVLKNQFYQVYVAYDTKESVLVPIQEYRFEEGSQLVSSLYGAASAAVTIAESVAEWQLYNVYGVPKEIQEWITRSFPTAKCRHQYSLGLKQIQSNPQGHLYVDFRKEDFTVMAATQGKLLLAQTYSYTTPEDIVYYLLRIVQQFALSAEEVTVILSGLIDKESALYKELYQYFLQIEFRSVSWNAGDYPAHFFSSLNDLARCES